MFVFFVLQTGFSSSYNVKRLIHLFTHIHSLVTAAAMQGGSLTTRSVLQEHFTI